LQNAERAVGELEKCDQSVLSLDRMVQGLACGLHTDHVSEQPQHQIHGVNGLID